MSCIAKLLDLKGEKDFIAAPRNPDIIIEDGGKYKGFEYITILNSIGFRCGYVAITPDHPLYDFQKNDDPFTYFPDLDVHGGVTFFEKQHLIESECNDKWIGFDCGHAGDGWDYNIARSRFEKLGNDKAAKSIREVQKIRERVRMEMEDDHPGHTDMMKDFETVKTKEYVIEECKRMIDQLLNQMEAA